MGKMLAVLFKDVRVELRSRYMINTILLFGVTALTVVSYTLGQIGLPPRVLAALYWIVMFFAAISGLSQTFVREEDAKTALTLKLIAEPTPVLLGKMVFNFMLLALIAAIVTPLFMVFTDAVAEQLLVLLFVILLGVLGLCSGTTLVAAIIARASIKGALFAVLALPVVMPLLIVLVLATAKLFGGGGSPAQEVQFLIAYIVAMTTLSLMLFKFVWQS